MPKFVKIKALEHKSLEQIGFTWAKDGDGEYIVRESLICVTKKEAKAYAKATNRLYEMYESAAEYVIKNNLFKNLDIPEHLISQIEYSWKYERGNHLYGRFDLSGGLDKRLIKLIEFNADTPTLLIESALVQWMLLQNSHLKNKEQFNTIYESIGTKAEAIAEAYKGDFSRFLFACVKDIQEEYHTTKLLQKIIADRGLLTEFTFLEDIELREQSVCDEKQRAYDFFFKLYPWEEMQSFEQSKNTKILNPAYTLLYQSKGILAILYELFPDSPYLVETSFTPLVQKHVKKPMFGREGENIEIVEDGKIVHKREGIYGDYNSVYQEYIEFMQDDEGRYYQAGVFYSKEACGLGFRRGAEILDDMSQFMGHFVE